jgi:hypothetical protein
MGQRTELRLIRTAEGAFQVIDPDGVVRCHNDGRTATRSLMEAIVLFGEIAHLEWRPVRFDLHRRDDDQRRLL